ncbi:MAG: hypothetical protein HQM10_04380 [Candidatus Riflebacteria bacterium]|nr:hypothetical protein [Candidatus Riflebacteria bacterium]
MKKLISIFFISGFLFLLTGCGGGGGSSSNPLVPITEKTVTINGKIQADEISDSLLASLHFAASSAIDFSKFSVKIGTLDKLYSVNKEGTYSISVAESSVNTNSNLILNVLSPAKSVILRGQLELKSGESSYSDVNINPTTTALVFLVEKDSSLTVSKILAQEYPALYTGLTEQINSWLKIASASSDITKVEALKNEATKAVSDFSLIDIIKAKESQINANYAALKESFENNNASISSRVDVLMSYIHPDFVNGAGNAAYDDLKNTTLSRFDRYQISKFDFSVQKISHTASDTIVVETPIFIDIKLLPGKEGGVMAVSGPVTPIPQMIWKYSGGKWLIIKGLPYLRDELQF